MTEERKPIYVNFRISSLIEAKTMREMIRSLILTGKEDAERELHSGGYLLVAKRARELGFLSRIEMALNGTVNTLE